MLYLIQVVKRVNGMHLKKYRTAEIFAGCKFSRFSRTDQLPRKYKPQKNEPRWNWYVIRIGTSVNEMVLYSLSAAKIMSSLWMVAAKQTPSAMCTKYPVESQPYRITFKTRDLISHWFNVLWKKNGVQSIRASRQNFSSFPGYFSTP